MNPTTVFCPNLACPARGQTGQGNIGIHSRHEKRFICIQCHNLPHHQRHGVLSSADFDGHGDPDRDPDGARVPPAGHRCRFRRG